MKLILKDQYAKLLAQGQALENDPNLDVMPIVKLFNPYHQHRWLLASLEPDCPDIAYGLCDLGMGYPELGTVSLSELEEIRQSASLPLIERDQFSTPEKSLHAYLQAQKSGAMLMALVSAKPILTAIHKRVRAVVCLKKGKIKGGCYAEKAS